VALLPEGWAQARAGAAIVVGARAAVWGPCPALAAVVVVDSHDEALAQEQAPTWHAAPLAAERARRVGVPCLWVTPCPTVEQVAAAPVVAADRSVEAGGWARLEAVDRRRDDPRLGLYSERLTQLLRGDDRVVCVLNRTGRARLLACAACGELAACERCGAAVRQIGQPSVLSCPRCGETRPQVCAACGSTVLRALRVGVSRAREELEALAGRPVGEVTATTSSRPDAPVVVGTEAVLRRPGRADVVAFLEFDQELLAPRFRAGEEALALLARASWLVGGRRGRVLVQTRLPEHPVVEAARRADPGALVEAEAPVRAALRLPPASALAAVSGPAAGAMAEALGATVAASRFAAVEVLQGEGERWLVRAPNHPMLADVLAAAGRPAGRVRVEVDPQRV
jgi:primosomal protein N' (replication factor Y)